MIGLIAISLGILAFVDPALGLLLLAFFFAFALLFLGIARLASAFGGGQPEQARKGLDIALGLGAIVVSFIVFLVPGLGILTLLIVLYIGLILIGLTWMAAAFGTAGAPGWFKALGIVMGILAIVFAIVAIIYPSVGLYVLAFLFGVVLILMGIGDIMTGVSGKPWVMVHMPTSMDDMKSQPMGGTPPAAPPAK